MPFIRNVSVLPTYTYARASKRTTDKPLRRLFNNCKSMEWNALSFTCKRSDDGGRENGLGGEVVLAIERIKNQIWLGQTANKSYWGDKNGCKTNRRTRTVCKVDEKTEMKMKQTNEREKIAFNSVDCGIYVMWAAWDVHARDNGRKNEITYAKSIKMHCAWCRCSFASGLAHCEFPILAQKFNHSHMANGASVHKKRNHSKSLAE